jgi:putative tricarboxylic transport membrane protein
VASQSGSPNWQDLGAGSLFASLGLCGLVLTWRLESGTLLNMGAGLFPRAVALILLGFGIVLVGRAVLVRGPVEMTFSSRPVLFVLAALLFFAVFVQTLGLAITAAATFVLASLASRDARIGETLLWGLLLSAACTAVFVSLLRLPIPILPP